VSEPLVLDAALIGRLIAALREQDVPMVDHLNPGLSEREMAALVAPLGITLPQEAAAWWGYADGVPLDTPGSTNLSPSWSWRPLAAISKDGSLDIGRCNVVRRP
jgi:hypothetical protein